MNTYKITKTIVRENEDGTKTRKTVTVNTGLTFAQAKAERKMDKTLSIVKETE